MIRKHSALKLLVIVSCVIAQLFAVAPAAHAVIDCVSVWRSYFDGRMTSANGPGGSYEGTTAWIVDNTAPVCENGNTNPEGNFTFVWSMIASKDGGGVDGYAQTGIFRGYGSSCTTFTTESKRDNVDIYHRDHWGSCITANGTTSNQQWVQFDPALNAAGGLRMNTDTTSWTHTSWTPFSHWVTPFRAEWSGETYYVGSNVPTTNFSQMQIQQINEVYTGTIPTLSDICPWPARYIKGTYSNNFFAIQTSGNSSALNCDV